MGKCKHPENHGNHICELKIQQKLDVVKDLKAGAVYYCENCDAPSRLPEHLCMPKEYAGKPGILKWKR